MAASGLRGRWSASKDVSGSSPEHSGRVPRKLRPYNIEREGDGLPWAAKHPEVQFRDEFMASIDIGGIAVPDDALTFRFVRASGPGGQNVNKVSTAVEGRLNLDAAGIRGAFRERLERMAGSRLTTAGEIVVFADNHRTQPRNREAAQARLAALIEEALPEPRRRVPTRPTAGARARRHEDKRRRAGVKKLRGSVDPPDD